MSVPNPFAMIGMRLRRGLRDPARLILWMAHDIDRLRRRGATIVGAGDIAHLGWAGWQLGAHFPAAFALAHQVRETREREDRLRRARARRDAMEASHDA